MRIKKVKLLPAKFAVDLSDGSERGGYVNQDYILQKLKRPHRGVNLMYCYYPLDEGWPKRARDAYKDTEVDFAWDYPYDDYFPYEGGLSKDGSPRGNKSGEPFDFMRDIRRHGQDVILTITCDPKISDEHIIAIARDLRSFGRMMLRINHEATGNWFSFNKRATYQEVAVFYVRFCKIMKEHAPNVRMILCIGGIEDPNPEVKEIVYEKEFAEAVRVTDIWSVDKYLALNWGWPYEVAEKDNNQHKRDSVKEIYDMTKRSYYRFKELNNGIGKPMVMSELNADGDVTGIYEQVKMVKEFYDLVKNDPDRWFSGITFYQFRDDGRLGLETTDPGNPDVAIEQPLMAAYREIINDDFFKPVFEDAGDVADANDVNGAYGGGISLPVTLRWGGAEDAEGIGMMLELEGQPVFAEANFKGSLKDACLMMEINGRWFYKAPGVTFVDFMPAFCDRNGSGIGSADNNKSVELRIFATPADGENNPSQGDDWAENCYYTMNELPDIRLRYEPIMPEK